MAQAAQTTTNPADIPIPIGIVTDPRIGARGCCVEVALLSGRHVALRDDKAPDGPVLIVTPDAWAAFAAAMSDGEFAF